LDSQSVVISSGVVGNLFMEIYIVLLCEDIRVAQ